MSYLIPVFQVIILIYSAIIHEYMHGWMAYQLGDSTAKDAGRLSLNPLVHIDLFGSILLPLMLIASGTKFVFGWAKPVPYNPYNLRDAQYGPAKVAIAGPLANFITAVFFGLLLRILFYFPALHLLNSTTIYLLQIIIYINLLLMVFNLVPIPPLDGSKVIMPFLPTNWKIQYMKLEPYGMILVIFFVMFLFPVITPIIEFLYNVIVVWGL